MCQAWSNNTYIYPFWSWKKGDLFPKEAVFHDAYKQHETIVSWKSTCKYLLYGFNLADIHINSNMGVEWNGWNFLNNIIFNCGYKIIWKKIYISFQPNQCIFHMLCHGIKFDNGNDNNKSFAIIISLNTFTLLESLLLTWIGVSFTNMD